MQEKQYEHHVSSKPLIVKMTIISLSVDAPTLSKSSKPDCSRDIMCYSPANIRPYPKPGPPKATI